MGGATTPMVAVHTGAAATMEAVATPAAAAHQSMASVEASIGMVPRAARRVAGSGVGAPTTTSARAWTATTRAMVGIVGAAVDCRQMPPWCSFDLAQDGSAGHDNSGWHKTRLDMAQGAQ